MSCALLAMGLFLIVANWATFFHNYFVRERHVSWTPLFGGLLTAVGLALFPGGGLVKYAWIPFIVDYGCLIGLTHTAWFWIFKYPKIKKEP